MATIRNKLGHRPSHSLQRRGGEEFVFSLIGPRGSDAVTRCHLGTFPKPRRGDGRPMWRIPALSGAGLRQLSRRWPKSGKNEAAIGKPFRWQNRHLANELRSDGTSW